LADAGAGATVAPISADPGGASEWRFADGARGADAANAADSPNGRLLGAIAAVRAGCSLPPLSAEARNAAVGAKRLSVSARVPARAADCANGRDSVDVGDRVRLRWSVPEAAFVGGGLALTVAFGVGESVGELVGQLAVWK
jgi:hypothetical protein